MDAGRWERLQAIFNHAASLPADERDAFVRSECGSDQELNDEVRSMLRHDASPSPLDEDLADTAAATLGSSPSLIGGALGPYRIVRLIGEGGMGVVYLAERADLDARVAVKVLRDASLSPSRRERFFAEQRTLALLSHPAIARIFDAAVLPDGTPYFVMEYIDGIPLMQYFRGGKYSIAHRLRMLRDVCEAVRHAHGQAVIHRDLKPSNILVKRGGSVHLLDFGISKQIEAFAPEQDLTVTGLRLLTPAYASPEQFRGERVGVGADVYSLGVILYELLAGKPPFDLSHLTPAEAAEAITRRDPVKPSIAARRAGATGDALTCTLSRSAWADLDVLCLKAMHKDPRRRYPSAEALIRDIDNYLDNKPLEARPEGLGYRVSKFVRRNFPAVLATGVVLLVITSMAAWFTVRLAVARDAALAEAARTQRIQKFMTSLFQGGDPSAGPDYTLRVITLLDRGVGEARALKDDPEAQAELYDTLGGLYDSLGKLDTADSLLSDSLSLRKSIFGGDSPEVGEALVALGRLRDDQARLPEAEHLIRQGLDIEGRHLDPGHPEIVKATTALGKVLEDRGSYKAAIQVLAAAAAIRPGSEPIAPNLADTFYELANSHFYAGHYDIAEDLNQKLLPVYRALYGAGHPRIADVYVNLAAIRHDRTRYAEAEALERQALQIVESWYGENSPITAADLTMLGRTLVFEDRYDEAVTLLRRSLAIKEVVYGPAHPSVASSLNELGNTAVREHRYKDAEQYFTRMAAIYHEIYGDHHYLVGIATSNLAAAFAGEKDWARAEPLFRQAVHIFAAAQSPTHINTGIARTKLGHVLLAEKQYAAAAEESHAGYEILVKQIEPTASWLINARKDLAEEFDALNEPDNARRYRQELASTGATSPGLSPPVGSR